jgi:hypothetical protein
MHGHPPGRMLEGWQKRADGGRGARAADADRGRWRELRIARRANQGKVYRVLKMMPCLPYRGAVPRWVGGKLAPLPRADLEGYQLFFVVVDS